MKANWNDILSGSIFVGVAALYGITSYYTLPFGRALNMGPGYFPSILAGVLALFGAAIITRSFLRQTIASPRDIPWRALVMISVAIVFFGLFVRELGLLATVFLTCMLAATAQRGFAWRRSLLVSAAISAFCAAVFIAGVGIPVPALGEWLRF